MLEHLCSNDLYNVVVYSRWLVEEGWTQMLPVFFSGLPGFLKPIVPPLVRRNIANWLHGQGFSRHSDHDIVVIIEEALEALSITLGDKPYFNGDEPTVADPAVFGILDALMGIDVDPLHLQDLVQRKFPNLVAFVQRIHTEVYGRGK